MPAKPNYANEIKRFFHISSNPNKNYFQHAWSCLKPGNDSIVFKDIQ